MFTEHIYMETKYFLNLLRSCKLYSKTTKELPCKYKKHACLHPTNKYNQDIKPF